MKRLTDGRETWSALLNWDKGQAPSERLSAQVLRYEKFESIDPSHPLGGQDGTKDILCKKYDKELVAACFFPRGQKSFKEIKKKFKEDAEGIDSNKAEGIVFITNQELRLSERDDLKAEIDSKYQVEIYHLERIASLLNSPENYGIRLEFLDIEMTKEEQLAYMVTKDQVIHDLTSFIKQIVPATSQFMLEESLKTAIEVIPEYIPVNNISYALYPKPYHKCSYCKYGFKIAGSRLDYITGGTAMYTASVMVGPAIGIKLITCPKCGNTEEFFGI